MDRRTVFLASVGALSVVACGGEPVEAYGEVQQAATVITPTMLIKSVSVSGTTQGSAMKLSVVVLPELYLGTITLVKGGSGVATTGRYAKGSPKRPGSAEGTIAAVLWDRILADSKTDTLSIEMTYNTTTATFNEIFVELV